MEQQGGKIVKGGSSTSSSPNFRVRKDAPLTHKLTTNLRELNLRSVICDRSSNSKQKLVELKLPEAYDITVASN